MRAALLALSLTFLIAHACALPRTLEDIDSINFALGVESFDVPAHRPHPPGYPVYIALAKATTAPLAIDDRDRRAAIGLAIWGVLAGAAAVFVFAAFWSAVGVPPGLAAAAAVASVCAPLFWFTASRPLSDVLGLVAAIAVQAGLIYGWRALQSGAPNASRALVWSAFAAGVVLGIRSQSLWINGPFVAWCLVALLRRRRGREAALVAGAAAIGALLWAVPLVWDSGGPAAYLRALRSQGAQDFSGVAMLATTGSPDVLERSLSRTFITPWLNKTLAHVTILFALAGLLRLALRRRESLALVLVTFVPYLSFHLAFQETVTLRYALPVVVGLAGCSIVGWSWFGTRAAVIAAAAASIAGVAFAQPRLQAYSSGGWPIHRAFQDMQRALPSAPEPPLVKTHHQVWHGVQRLFDWYRPYWDVGPQPFPFDREWLDVVAHWRNGGTRPVWFLGDLTRNDVLLFDPRFRRLGGRYETPPGLREVVGADTRLDGLNWWILDRPFWMLGPGWSITPEVAGMTRLDKLGPQVKPAEAYILATPNPVRMLIGGRYLEPGGPPARVVVDLDGRRIAEWSATPAQPWFTQWIEVERVGAAPGAFSTLAVRVESEVPGRPAPWVGLEQFDAATSPGADAPIGSIFALTSGWHELEHDPATGRTWRWSTERAMVTVRGGSGDATLTLAGESPLKYFDRAPSVVIRAGDVEVGRLQPAADFSQTFVIPAAALEAAAGEISIATDMTFVPGDREQSADRRQLGLRLFEVRVER